MIKRAETFFSTALVPLEHVHRATCESFQQLQRRAAALIEDNRRLRREVLRRIAGEAAEKKGKERYHRLFAQSQFMQEDLRRLARQILFAHEDERRKISRALHDQVLQTLVGINLHLVALGNAAAIENPALKASLAHTQRLVGKSINTVYQFTHELRPAILDEFGLIAALDAYLKSVAARSLLRISLTASTGAETLDDAKCTVLYRVAQEALTNVTRHAQASRVSVSINKMPGAICMEVHDNGKSIPLAPRRSVRIDRALVLVGMRERVEMVGGTLTIESVRGQGTTVHAEIPFSRNGPHERGEAAS